MLQATVLLSGEMRLPLCMLVMFAQPGSGVGLGRQVHRAAVHQQGGDWGLINGRGSHGPAGRGAAVNAPLAVQAEPPGTIQRTACPVSAAIRS